MVRNFEKLLTSENSVFIQTQPCRMRAGMNKAVKRTHAYKKNVKKTRERLMSVSELPERIFFTLLS